MQTLEFNDYLEAFVRRKWLAMGVAAAALVVSLLLAFLLPPKYESTSIIQIEQQEVPQDLVRSTITSFADQRVQMIGQRIQSAQNLERIIEKFGLYADDLDRDGLEKVLIKMRKAIGLEMISADVVDPRSGRPTQANIAFRLSYENRNPALAQKVANELSELYLSENRRNRTRLATDTANFLADEAEKLQRKIKELETRLASFKEEHVGSLPQQADLNLQLLQRTENQLLELDRQLRSLDERKVYLESELAQLEPYSALVDEDGKLVPTPSQRLRSLENRFALVSARYTERHPDYRKLQAEIQQLKAELAESGDTDEAVQDAVEPEGEALSMSDSKDALFTEGAPTNPAYVQLQTQLEAAETEMRSLRDTRATLMRKLDDIEVRLTQAPQVEREYREMSREYEAAMKQYATTQSRQMEAQLAESLERGRKGERFSVIEPPRMPVEPVSPNRTMIVILGFMLAMGAGVGSLMAAEVLDKAVHGVRGVTRVVGVAPIATIPSIITDSESRRERMVQAYALAVSVLFVPLLFAVVHFSYRPLDVLWFKIIRKLGLM